MRNGAIDMRRPSSPRYLLSRVAAPWLLVAPTQILLWVVIGLPSLYVIWLSLTHSTYGSRPIWAGIDNYRTVLSDPYFWRALVNTLIVVNAIVYIELVLAVGVALLLASEMPFRKLMVAMVLTPYAVSEVVAVMIWRYLMDPDIGPVTHALHAIGLAMPDWSVSPVAGLGLVGLINVWTNFPFTFVVLYTGLLAIPNELYEAARIDGAGAWAEFRWVTLPMLMPAILVAVLFRLIFAFRMFTEVWLLTHGGPARSTELVALYLYVTGFRYSDFGSAAAIGCLMLLGSLLLALPWLRRAQRGMFADA